MPHCETDNTNCYHQSVELIQSSVRTSLNWMYQLSFIRAVTQMLPSVANSVSDNSSCHSDSVVHGCMAVVVDTITYSLVYRFQAIVIIFLTWTLSCVWSLFSVLILCNKGHLSFPLTIVSHTGAYFVFCSIKPSNLERGYDECVIWCMHNGFIIFAWILLIEI